jgi:hypothetical protein
VHVQALRRDLLKWQRDQGELLETSHRSILPSVRRESSLLLIHHAIVLMEVTGAACNTEQVYDQLDADFGRVLDLASELLSCATVQGFTLDTRVLYRSTLRQSDAGTRAFAREPCLCSTKGGFK